MPEKKNTLLKSLLSSGLGSRRKLADLIRQGKIRVNGIMAENFNQPVNLKKDKITLNGEKINIKPQQIIVLILNKPAGIITTTSDEMNRRTVIDILPLKYRNKGLYPVGRLDKDSTGLILLTNDGDITYKLTHPKFEHEKEYLVCIDGKLSLQEKEKLQKGILLEDGITYPARVKEIRTSPPFNYSLTIHEGRKHQVRRMFEASGHTVVALKRTRIGGISLGNLGEWKIKELSPKEIKQLTRSGFKPY